MRKIGNVLFVATAIASIGLVIWLTFQQEARKNQKKTQIQAQKNVDAKKTEEAKKEPVDTWPENARFGVCSSDGKTVAIMSDRTIIVLRDGKELFRNTKINALHPQLRLSPNGSRLAAYCLWRKQLLILDTENGKEVLAVDDRSVNPTFTFSPSGDQIILQKSSKGPQRFDTLSDARKVPTEAMCSDDGRTVAVIAGSETKLYRQGEFLSTRKTLIGQQLNRDGSRLLGYDKARKVVVLTETVNIREHVALEASDDAQFMFSPGGNTFGVMEPDATELPLYWSWSGERRVVLPATYSFRLSGERYVLKYTLARFHFYEVEPTDKDLTVTMSTKTKDGKPYETYVQWSANRSDHWRNVERVLGCLDQDMDFNPDGSLTQYAHRAKE